MGHSKVLISNRGEIAIRIAKAAAGLGIESVSVHPAEDDRSLHTRFTGESVELPPVSKNDPVAAYLNIEAIIEAAVSTGCDCVHPGYGFLAENPRFAERCAEAGLTFIGPSPAALALFGNKVAARDLARSLGVPIIDGSNVPVSSSEVAAAEAERIGYPIMLKAAAGGGGRGMRAVTGPQDLAEAFDRCRSEAEAAFGDGTVFMERLVVDPRHIEVQILADADGNTIHLFERDCSVQQRNQKVVEVAPAAGLDGALRQQILDDAVNLVSAADYANAGTVEFLVSPETGEHFFIECNPRVQVEHTITEQVMAIDIVEAQFHLAAGASLASLGLGDQAAVGEPRGFAVQARVVATGPGTISAYREPSGPGVRVDGAGYLGYTPPPQFDPLLAKVIGSSGFAANLESAVDRTARALAEFHIDGLPTNLIMLQALLANERVRSGDARTTLIGADPNLNGAGSGSSTAVGAGAGNPSVTPSRAPAAGGPLPLLEEQARSITNGTDLGHAKATSGPLAPIIAAGPSLVVADGHRAVEVPVDSTVIEVRASEGDRVNAGDTLLVVNAMKMETTVVAPCAGTIAAIAPVAVDDTVGAGQVIATIAASAEGDAGGSDDAGAEGTVTEDGWQETLDEVATLHRLALARLGPDSEEPGVVRQRNRNKLDCRQRIDQLLDEGSFREVGSITGFASHDDQGNISAFTPSNHVGGWGDIDGRTAIVCADDFTSRGGHADGAIGEKSRYLDELSTELGVPSVRLLDGSSGGGSVAAMVPEQQKEGESNAKESSGAITAGRPRVAGGGGSFLPGHLGSTMYTKQLTTVPVVNLLLGSVVGIGAAKAVLGHFSVMVRDVAQLFVAGPPVVSHAMGYDITKEDLGGWHIHCRNGSVDNLAESEEEAFDMTRRFLSYLPANVFEPPPVLAPTSLTSSSTSSSNPGRGHTALEEELATLIPRKRTATFDIRRAIELLADPGSFFEIGGLWGADQVTGFVRFNGHPLGVIASDSRHVNGGALTADGCDKLTRHLDLCDLFHIPVLNLVDNPGFAVGLEHEINGTIRKGAEWMVAFAQVNVPIFTVLMRRSFGVAGNNYATPKAEPSVRVTWPAADVGGIPPEGGIEAAYKRQLAEAEDPAALRAELNARIESVRGPMGPLSKFQIEEMIDPRDTRRYICEWVPNAYRQVARADRLGPRDLQFRP